MDQIKGQRHADDDLDTYSVRGKAVLIQGQRHADDDLNTYSGRGKAVLVDYAPLLSAKLGPIFRTWRTSSA